MNLVSIPHRRSFYQLPNPDSLPSDSSRSNSASWSLTSLGRADRSTPRSAIVASTAACGMFAMSRVTAGTDRHEAEGMKSGRSSVYSIFVTPRHRHDCGRWGVGGDSPEESVSHMTRADGARCDSGGGIMCAPCSIYRWVPAASRRSGAPTVGLCRQPGSRQTVLGKRT